MIVITKKNVFFQNNQVLQKGISVQVHKKPTMKNEVTEIIKHSSRMSFLPAFKSVEKIKMKR